MEGIPPGHVASDITRDCWRMAARVHAFVGRSCPVQFRVGSQRKHIADADLLENSSRRHTGDQRDGDAAHPARLRDRYNRAISATAST